jgi:hypothetical protein
MPGETEKLDAVSESYADVGEFVDWLGEQSDLTLATWLTVDGNGNPRIEPLLVPASIAREELLARYFGIDRDKLEQERRNLLKSLRRLGAERVEPTTDDDRYGGLR